MFGWKNKVVKHGVLYGSRGIYVQTCRTCGCVYETRWKKLEVRVNSLTDKRYLYTECPECRAANREEITRS